MVQPILLLGGLYANVGELPGWLYIFTYLSPVYYNFQNLVYNEWSDSSTLSSTSDTTKEVEEVAEANEEAFVQFLGFTDSYWSVILKMVILICIVHILALIFLHILKQRFS